MTDIPAPTDTEALARAAREAAAHAEVTEIRPDHGWFELDLGVLWRFRELLVVLIGRDIQVLYKQAALGAGWAVIQPVLAVAIFTVIFGKFAGMPSDGVPYPVFAFAGLLPWTYFSEALRRASNGLVEDAELIRKVYFPRLLMPLARVSAPLLDLSIAFVALLVLMAAYGIMPTWRLIAVPPLAIVALLFALSVGLFLGPINVRFRDVKHTVPFLIQIWMYACPIVYPYSMVPESWRWAYSLNPMVGVIEGFRWAILGRGSPELLPSAIAGVIIMVLLATGLIFFKRMERFFADTI